MSKKRTRKKDSYDIGQDVSAGWEFKPSKYVRCHEKHPVLSMGGGTVLGASCLQPRDGYDIYVGLDWGMARSLAPFPWNPPVKSKVVEVYFPITDGGVPKDVVQFKRMVDWLVDHLAQGKRVHIGCIGGHGRTGLLLAALVRRIHDNPEAGAWVRQHYCKSAIETKAQVQFLETHFGVVPVEPAKADLWGAQGVSLSGAYTSSTGVPTSYAPLMSASVWDLKRVKAERKDDLTNYDYPIY